MAFDAREPVPGLRLLVPTGLERAGVLAAFSGRAGGVSQGPYRSLNVGFGVGDDPAAVRANRRRLAAALSLDAFAVAGLVHGARLARVGPRRAGAGFADPGGRIRGADGLLATAAGLAVAVTCADCLPVVLAPGDGRSVAVVHAGWRGIAAGILQRAVAALGRPDELRAAIGPAVRPCHYEVGEDVARAVARGAEGRAVTSRRGGRIALDLVATAARALRLLGVRRVEVADLCTACHPDRFFSHRRDGTTGRQAAIAVRLGG
jgi:YfiH family protein